MINRRQLRKESIGFLLVNLPHEIIQLIFSFIPDDFLETYIDIPFIGEYAVDIVYRFISIIASHWEFNEHWQVRRKGSNLISKHVFNDPENPETREGVFYKYLRVNQFIQLISNHPRFTPEIVQFRQFDRFLWLHQRYPDILKRLPRIDISFIGEEPSSSPALSFDTQYNNIYRVSSLPEQFEYNDKLFSSISSLHTMSLPKWAGQNWCENIQELELETGPYDELSRLFPNLRRLRMSLNYQGSLKNLPLRLEFLMVEICDSSVEFDISYLANLREIIACADSNSLKHFKFPLGVERVLLFDRYYPGDPRDVLLNMELYPNLKEYWIVLHGQYFATSMFSYNTTCPQSLQNLQIVVSEDILVDDLSTIGEFLKLPEKLRDFHFVAFDAQTLLEKLVLPPSLRVLSILDHAFRTGQDCEMKDWSGVKFPDSLVQLNVEVRIPEGLVLPKSLHSLSVFSEYSPTSLNLLELQNLVQLKLKYPCRESREFIYKLPTNLKTLYLSGAENLNKVIIEAPNLHRVNLAWTGLKYLDPSHFRLPDCVELLAIRVYEGITKIESNVLPAMLRELSVPKSHVTCDRLDQFKFANYKHLENLDLYGNEISELKCNNLPSTLKWINLDRNPICSFSNPTIFSDLGNLKHISMASTKINEYFQSDGLMLYFPSSLISLNLADNNLEAGVAAKLIFLSCTQLQELNLAGNPKMADVQLVIDSINSSCPNIVELVLDDLLREHVREDGIDFLSFCLVRPRSWK